MCLWREVESTNWSLWSAKTSRIPPSKKWNFERDLLRRWQDSVWDSIVWNHQPDPTDRWLETLRHTHARENAGCTWECKKLDRTPCLFSCLPKRYRRVFFLLFCRDREMGLEWARANVMQLIIHFIVGGRGMIIQYLRFPITMGEEPRWGTWHEELRCQHPLSRCAVKICVFLRRLSSENNSRFCPKLQLPLRWKIEETVGWWWH
jgi:hypothetical protein